MDEERFVGWYLLECNLKLRNNPHKRCRNYKIPL